MLACPSAPGKKECPKWAGGSLKTPMNWGLLKTTSPFVIKILSILSCWGAALRLVQPPALYSYHGCKQIVDLMSTHPQVHGLIPPWLASAFSGSDALLMSWHMARPAFVESSNTCLTRFRYCRNCSRNAILQRPAGGAHSKHLVVVRPSTGRR